nr:PREDICTED: peptide transporter family 1-like [Bemisia tabaci]
MTAANNHGEKVPEKSLKYPKSVFFIISNEFCERYSFFGLRKILSLYLRNALHFRESEAVSIYHGFMFFNFAFPILGGILADSYIGKYQTIAYSSIVHTVGNLTVALASTPWISSSRIFTFVGLILVATGAGLMKPCISTLGGEQFVLPQQAKQMATFFSVFYFTISIGSLLASIVSPILRQDVKCLEQPSCYPLAFGVPAFLMFLALVLFVCGKPWYMMKEPEGNILVGAMKCIFYALRKKLSCAKLAEKPSYWLDYAKDKFDQRLLKDTREMIRLLPTFIPVPLYWALSEQQGSSWIFQASQMDGVVPNWFTIKPDQLGLLSPLFVVILIPIFEISVYPMLGKMGVKSPLQYITTGALTCACAFLMSSYVEYRLEPSYAKLPAPGLGQLRIFNGLPCQVELDPPIHGRYLIPPLGALQWTDIQVNGTRFLQEKLVLNLGLPCNDTHMPLNWTEEILLFEERGSSYILGVSGEVADIKRVPGFDDVSKSLTNAPRIRVIHNLDGPLTLTNQYKDTFKFQLLTSQLATPLSEITTGRYQIMFGSKKILSDLIIESGGVYTLVLQKVHSKIVGKLHTITQPAQLHILWMVPQIIVMAISEIFFSVTYLSFTFNEVKHLIQLTIL